MPSCSGISLFTAVSTATGGGLTVVLAGLLITLLQITGEGEGFETVRAA